MENVEDIYVLTPSQEGILYHSITESGESVYIEQLVCQFEGNLDSARLRAAWQDVVDRQPALRTVFLWEDLDEPLQIVREKIDLDWAEQDWRAGNEIDCTDRWQIFVTEEREHPLSISASPPSRVKLVRVSDDRHQLLWTFHHLLLDGWSTASVIHEVLERYAPTTSTADRQRPIERISVKDYLSWSSGQNEQLGEAFWKSELQGFRSPSQIGFHDRLQHEGASQRLDFHCDGQSYESLQSVARENRITVSTLVHTAWALLLGRYCDQDDVIFGSTVSGRPTELAGSETLIGCFIKTLPFRVQMDGKCTVGQWLRELQEKHVRIRESDPCPLAKIQSLADVETRTPLFDSVVVFENYPDALFDLELPELRLSKFDIVEQSHYAFALLAIPEKERLSFRLIQKNAAGDDELQRISRHFQTLLHWIADNLDQRLGDASMIDQKESDQMRIWGQGAKLDRGSKSTVMDFVVKDKNQIALIDCEGEVSYQQFCERVDQVASVLIKSGVSVGDHVGVCIDRSVDMIVSIFAILRAGAAYVPMDPEYPQARLDFIVADAQCKIVVASGRSTELFDNEKTIDIAGIDFAQNQDFEATRFPTIDENATAYLIYTSGSTGNPKGVPITHGNLLSSTLARKQYYSKTPSRFLLLSSISFDSSVAGVFWTLCSGGTLVLPKPGQEKDLAALERLMTQHQVTHTLCLPSLYGLLLERDSLESLKCVIVAGEECPPKLVRSHQKRTSHCELHNEYGPTEATVWSTVHPCSNVLPGAPIPIGKPIPESVVRLIDSHGNLVPAGIAGEIMLGGPGLFEGYWQNENETERRIGHWDRTTNTRLYRTGDRGYWTTEGELIFLGRTDNQVKIRGHRIELGEIEHALSELDGVSEAIVTTEDQLLSDDADFLVDALNRLPAAEAEQLLNEVSQR